MKKLPLYTSTLTPVEQCDPLELNPECNRCELSGAFKGKGKATNVCAGDIGKPEGLLIVIDSPTKEESKVKGAGLSKYRKYLGGLVKKYDHKLNYNNIALSFGLRCSTSKKAKIGMIRACRPYLAQTIKNCEAKKIIIIGNTASEVLLGRKVPAIRKAYSFLGDGTPVFLLPHPKTIMPNKFKRDAFEEDFKYALNTDPPWAPTDAIYRAVETVEDAEKACAELSSQEWYAFDTETFGRFHDNDFKIISLAASAKGFDDAWVWDRDAINDPALMAPMIKLWGRPDISVVGQNIKYDIQAVKNAFGIWIKNVVHADTRLWTKLLDVEAKASLDTLAEVIGMGGHKEEAQDGIRKALKQLREENIFEGHKGFALNPKAYAYNYIGDDILDRYCARDTVSTAKYAEHLEIPVLEDPARSFIWKDILQKSSHTYARVEDWGLNIDESNLDLFRVHIEQKISHTEAKLRSWTSINLNAPAQVASYLYGTLGMRVIRRTETGAPSTDMLALTMMKGKHPVIDSLLAYRKLNKLKTSYCDKIPMHLRDDGRIHCSFLLDGARTGRLSCMDPNLQQVSRAKTLEGKLLKNVYIASPGNTLVQFDYKTLEVRIAALLSNDRKMIDVLQSGVDFHQQTMENIGPMVFGLDKTQLTSRHRDIFKTVVFSKLYGAGNYSISKKLGVNVQVIDEAVNAIFEDYSTLRKFIQNSIKNTYKTGVTHTYWKGRVARTRQLHNITSPDDKLRSTAENGSFNTAVQGSANEYGVASANEAVDYIEDTVIDAKLVLTVHDSLVFDAKKEVVPQLVKDIRTIMEGHESGDVPLVVDIETGDAWGELETYKC